MDLDIEAGAKMFAKTKLFIRQQREQWLNEQESVLIVDHEDTTIDLWLVLDIYIQSIIDGDDWEDAIAQSFPDYPDTLDCVEILVNSPTVHDSIEQTQGRSRLVFFGGMEATSDYENY